MKRNLRIQCPQYGHWNRVPANKIFIEQNSSEPKVKVLIPMYKPLEVVKCRNAEKLWRNPNEQIVIYYW